MVDFSLIGSKLNHNNLPNERNSTKMSTTPVRSTLDKSNMEALSSIKKALENAMGLVGALMIIGSCDVIDDSQKNKSDSLFPSIEREVSISPTRPKQETTTRIANRALFLAIRSR
jgi:hypothetical protein